MSVAVSLAGSVKTRAAAKRRVARPCDVPAARPDQHPVIALDGVARVLLGWVMTAVTADVFPDLGTVISLAPATIATAAVLGIAAVGLAPLLGIRRLRHLDIPSTLRVAE